MLHVVHDAGVPIMSQCNDCGDYVPVHIAVKRGLVSPAEAGRARNDVRGFNGFCRCEGFVNTSRKEDEGCACFQGGRSH
jgi:hypothetical protein